MQHGSISEYVESNHMEDIKTIAEFTDCQVPLTNGNSSNFVDHLGFRYQIYFLLPLEILEFQSDVLITSSSPYLLCKFFKLKVLLQDRAGGYRNVHEIHVSTAFTR